jgi:hypothetical protein
MGGGHWHGRCRWPRRTIRGDVGVRPNPANKLTLISEILKTAIVGDAPRVDVLELPELAAIRAITDQRTQLARLAHLSRGILERTTLAHRHSAKLRHRRPRQAEFVAADAAAIYGALANPDTYAELTSHRGWSPDHYENWLSGTLTLLLLPPPPATTGPFK